MTGKEINNIMPELEKVAHTECIAVTFDRDSKQFSVLKRYKPTAVP